MTTDNPDPLEVWKAAISAYTKEADEEAYETSEELRIAADQAAAAIIAQHYAPVIAENERLREVALCEWEEETGWLIEEDGPHWIALAKDSWPRWKYSTRRSRYDSDLDLEMREYLTPIRRVKDANEAIRFARKQDAEAFLTLFSRYLLLAKVTEHAFDTRQALGAKP